MYIGVISGYFIEVSLDRHGFYSFINNKMRKLGIPLLVSLPLVGPVFTFIYAYTKNGFKSPSSFAHHWIISIKDAFSFEIKILSTSTYFKQSHLWFISLLLIFFIIFAIKDKLFTNHYSRYLKLKNKKLPSNSSVLLILFITLMSSALPMYYISRLYGPTSDPEPWIIFGFILQVQLTRLPIYFVYFVLGIYTNRNHWFKNDLITRHPFFWSAVSIIFTLVYYVMLHGYMNILFMHFLLYCLIRSAYCLVCLMTLISIEYNYNNNSGILNSVFSKNSFYIYLIHFFIVIILQLIMTNWSNGPSVIKFAVISLSSVIISLLISNYVIKPYPKLSICGLYAIIGLMLVYL